MTPELEARIIPGKVYDHDAYSQLVKDTVEKVLELGVKKGGEYAGDKDRLANFRRNGVGLGLPMETIWAVYAGKHWDAVIQYIKDLQNGFSRTRMEPIEGRLDDIIVYAILMKAMIHEREIKVRMAPSPREPAIPETLDAP